MVAGLLLAGCSAASSNAPDQRSDATAVPAPAATMTLTPPAASPSPTAPAGAPPPATFNPDAVHLKLDRVAAGFTQPTFVTNAGDGSRRLFVLEKAGIIRIVAGGRALAEPFLDIRASIRSTGSEQGLLGLAFHPKFRENGRFFVAYTAATKDSDNTIAEFHVSADPNRADPASGRVLLAIPDFAPNHNGGMLAFDRSGLLYAGTGDGGGGGDPQRNGQNRGALLGKVLRLDVDHGQPYAIPPGNPFATAQGARPEVWAYGLRNPWRFSFDRATGDLWIADVGQDKWEEVNLQPAAGQGGENYGWSIMEGTHCFRPATACDMTGLTLPIAEYNHDQGCSITGGYVYRGRAFPALTGAYYYGDYCSGRLWALHRNGSGAWQQTQLAKTAVAISSFGEDEAGELYLTGLSDGIVYQLASSGG